MNSHTKCDDNYRSSGKRNGTEALIESLAEVIPLIEKEKRGEK